MACTPATVAAYLRVSSQVQRKRDTIASQREAVAHHARRGRGWAIPDAYDPGRDAAAPGMALADERNASSSWRRRQCSVSGRSSFGRSSTSTGRSTTGAEAREISVARASRTARAPEVAAKRMAPRAGGHHLEPPDAPARPGGRTPATKPSRGISWCWTRHTTRDAAVQADRRKEARTRCSG